MLTTGVRTPVGHQDLRRGPGADRADRQRDRARAAGGGRHAQRLRRARGRRLLPGFRPEARPAGALRPDRGRCPDGGDERHRRRQCEHRDRGAGALSDQRPLLPRFAQRPRPPGPRAGAGDGRQAADSAGGDRDPEAGHRSLHAAQRERHAERLRLRGCGRARRGQLRGRGEARGARTRSTCPPGYTLAWSGQYEAMERVRERLQAGAAADAVPDLPAALPEHEVGAEDAADPAGGAVLGGGRDLAAVPARATT